MEREFQFAREGDRRERLYLENPGQPRRIVGVRVHMETDRDGKPVLVNPLESLAESAIHGLRGVKLDV